MLFVLDVVGKKSGKTQNDIQVPECCNAICAEIVPIVFHVGSDSLCVLPFFLCFHGGFLLSKAEGEQKLVCEGCGSRWRITIAKGRAEVKAFLEECPLCSVSVGLLEEASG